MSLPATVSHFDGSFEPDSLSEQQLAERGLLDGLTEGSRIATEMLFNRGAQLVIDASHVQTAHHKGLAVVPIAEVFADPTAIFIGFGFPNVFLAMPRADYDPKGPGWNRYAAFMFWRQASYVHDTKGRVQGGVLFEIRGLNPIAKNRLRMIAESHAGRRHVSCAHANAQVLNDAGFSSGGKPLTRSIRPMRLARRIWEHGLEYEGEPVQLRVVRTNGGSVSDHFAGVIRKEATSFGRAIKKMWNKTTQRFTGKCEPSESAPIIEPRPLRPAPVAAPSSSPGLELRVARPTRFALLLRVFWGEHPIFETVLNPQVHRLDNDDLADLAAPLKPFPNTPDAVTRLKKHVLFSRMTVMAIRGQMAKSMESMGELAGPTLMSMMQLGTPTEPFMYNVILTGTSVRISRLENRTIKDVKGANWVLSKHVLLSGYDPDVRWAGETWAEDGPDGRVMHINNNSGTYKPTPEQTEAAGRFLSHVFGVPAIVHILGDDQVASEEERST